MVRGEDQREVEAVDATYDLPYHCLMAWASSRNLRTRFALVTEEDLRLKRGGSLWLDMMQVERIPWQG